MKYIFLAGVHAVGKTTLTKELEKKIDIVSYSISDLIRKSGNNIPKNEKKTKDISNNQVLWIKELQNLNVENSTLILDGHFTLLNENEEVVPIDFNVFEKTNMDKIILIKQNPKEIKRRLLNRDGNEYSLDKIEFHQSKEEEFAKKYAKTKQIPIYIYDSNSDLESLVIFIDS
ncbi:ATP-binding protein [Clostridioides difficile]|uniref:ATP-binding protein n=1 Tax=Clostridioides difficile TaxID=1496 RepID=UPI00038C83C7|nr:ATP-binding protein [Clostridioides difficile]EQH19669.1 AAA domain protein [Clostridioides difficile DA00211]KJF62269.1 hypothetical protein TZ54_15800 [Clostridioides difficile]MCK3748956.1 ATP-binding protein [Clostridioides difficile]MCP8398953.1 ATP-binding protein [Clostridioides difficile]MCP8416114.1 ATP-binding protein [Clostridioides difficile]